MHKYKHKYRYNDIQLYATYSNIAPHLKILSQAYLRNQQHDACQQPPDDSPKDANTDAEFPTTSQFHHSALYVFHLHMSPCLHHILLVLGRSSLQYLVHGFALPGRIRYDRSGAQHGESEHDEYSTAGTAVGVDLDGECGFC